MAHSTYPAPRRPGASTLLSGWFSVIFEKKKKKKKITTSKCLDKKIHQLPEDLWWHREFWGTPFCAAFETVGREKGSILKSCLVLSSKEKLLGQHPNQCWAPATRAEWRGQGPEECIQIQGIPWFMVSEWEVWEQIYIESTKLGWTPLFYTLLIFVPKNTIEVDQSSEFHFLIARGR